MCSLNSFINIFNHEQWRALNNIVDEMLTSNHNILEHVNHGDSRNEPVDLNVIRIMNIITGNTSNVEQYKKKILDIFNDASITKKISVKTNLPQLELKRIQLNIMEKKSFIGPHTDSEHSNSYKVTAAIRLNSNCHGGELVIHNAKGTMQIRQNSNTVFLINSPDEHEVLPVTQGYRHSMIAVFG